MIVFLNDEHDLHQGQREMFRGELVPCFEKSVRVEKVIAELRSRGFADFNEPEQFSDQVLTSVHSDRYVDFLKTAWDQWVALDPDNARHDALPSVWPVREHRVDQLPSNFSAQMGLFSFDMGTPLTSGTWQAARKGGWCALSAADSVLAGANMAFALTRPPGHHAGYDYFGGYCFINNAALAVERLRQRGASRVAILDIDYHHGNGTQNLFYQRDDVFFISLHADPRTDYPFYLGYQDERGEGPGEGYNLNIPMPRGTTFSAWNDALVLALKQIAHYQADALVVSLGVDTYQDDPISGFKLQSEDYFNIGASIAAAALPTVIVFEGGYDLQTVGINTGNVLIGCSS